MKCSAILVLAVYCSQVFSAPSPACRSHECLPYTVLETKKGYEVRQYETSFWAVTEMARESEMWENVSDSSRTFHKLLDYIQGANQIALEMPMTSPVLEFHQVNDVKRGFMIPSKVGASAPKPTDSGVTLITLKPFQVYVRIFGGFPYGYFNNKNFFKPELEMLKSDLKRDGIKFTEDKFFTAGYDGPYRFIERRNEVMIPKN